MIRRAVVADFIVALASCLSIASSAGRLSVRDLAGSWRFGMDPRDAGVGERWFLRRLDDSVTLPGSMAENMRGEPVTVDTKWVGGIVDRSWFTEARFAPYRRPGNIKLPFWLTPLHVYYGAAWYQRDIDIPDGWSARRIASGLTVRRRA